MIESCQKYRIKTPFSGADWVIKNLEYRAEREVKKPSKKPVPTTMSEFGKTVADILGHVWRGIYHMDTDLLEKVDWSRDGLVVSIRNGEQLATFDYSQLTELVLLCHDHGIRLGIFAEFGGRLRLAFHQRRRDGGMSERHPTLEEAITSIREVEEPAA